MPGLLIVVQNPLKTMSSVNPNTISIQTALKLVDSKLTELGNGPHNPVQAEEYKKLSNHKQKLLLQIQGKSVFFRVFYRAALKFVEKLSHPAWPTE